MKIKTESLDHYGLIMGMIKELGIIDIIDEELTVKSGIKKITHGKAIAAMIINGLGYANKQLYLSPRFFEKKAISQLFEDENIKAEHFNKDTLGRTLDKIFEYGVSELYERIAKEALKRLGLIPSTYHLDSTSFHLDGDYKNQEEGTVYITKGYSRDNHPELNQVVLNLIVEHQAGIPVWMKPGNGNQSDSKEFAKILKEHIKSLKKANETKTKIIADAALFTSNGIKEIKKNNMLFISRVPARLKQAKEILQNHNPKEFIKLNENYQAITYNVEYEGIKQKWILYKSFYAKSREDKTIQKKFQKQQKQEEKLIKEFQKKRFYCENDANSALEEIAKKLECISITETKLIQKPKYKTKGRPKKNSKPTYYEYYFEIKTESNEKYLKQNKNKNSGLFILATNDITLSPNKLLDEYKSQQRVERGFRFLKSPKFLSDAMFLKNPKRIEAMLMIMTLALLVYSALEYKIRKELKIQNKTFPNQLGKPVQNPTTRWIFENFHEIQIVVIEELNKKVIANLLERNVFILDLLGDSYWKYYKIDEKI